MNKTKIILPGIAGRMGIHLANLIRQNPNCELAGATETASSPHLGQVQPEGFRIVSEMEACITQGEVLIDFTAPQATLRHAKLAVAHQKAMVIGTTGFSEQEKKELKTLLEKIPSVWAPNMSIGVNVLLKVAAQTAKYLGEGYDIEIVEAHHRHKKDAPSGTALALGESVAQAKGWSFQEVACYHREGQTGARPERQIGMQTLRGGDIVGDHTVMFAGAGEKIELSHHASNRDNFARGAVLAAQWVVKQTPGIYSMADVLDL